MIAIAESGRRWVNFSYPFRNRCNGFIYYNVFRWLEDFEFGNAAIFLNSNFDQVRNFGSGSDAGRLLDPGAVTTVMEHIAIQAEFRCAAPAAHVSAFAM